MAKKIIKIIIVIVCFVGISLSISNLVSVDLEAVAALEGTWNLLDRRCVGEPSNC